MRVDLNRGWTFSESIDTAFIKGESCADAVTVELPHTCKITPYDYFDESIYQMHCGYRCTLHIPAEWAGKRVLLHVGAAGHSAEVFVDGKKLFEHRCGYTAFDVELTGAITPGKDSLLVIGVDSREQQDIPPFGYVIDYMTYGGLYREVWLEVKEQSYIEDVFVRPALPGTVTAEVAVRGETSGLALRQSILYNGSAVARSETVPLQGGGTEAAVTEAAVTMPKLTVNGAKPWHVDSPVLYTAVIELVKGSEVLDSYEARFGFRSAEFRADGFYLNGKKLKIRGLNRHQSYPYIGYAAPKSLQRFDAELLKNELGCNAVRTSHYPQSQHFIDRCDELGLLVFTEIPGWQHIGGEAWQEQAVKNTEDMVRQYRNHPSIILWGVRINESVDNDELYKKTNAAAHRLDPTRQTGGVRCYKKGSLLEDVYTYNDFVHSGDNKGCEPKKNVTPDMNKGYMVTEYCGHMYPTKAYDCEEHRLEHALRHANVLDAVAGQSDIAGSFGWCMADYNTHKDFGSGDRICYHGVTDMFRYKKLAAEVYASQGCKEPVLEVSSSMDIGEHPAANRGRLFAFTNAKAVRLYKNDTFIREFSANDSPYKQLSHPPIEIDDFIGDLIEKNEGFTKKQADYVKELINYSSRFGMSKLKPKHILMAAWLMLRYRMSFADAYALFGKYNSNWGDAATVFRFEAVEDGKMTASVEKGPFLRCVLTAEASSTSLCEGATYEAALVRITMRDQYGNVLPFYNEGVALEAEGPIEIIGPAVASLRGGMGGTIVKTLGTAGEAKLKLAAPGGESTEIRFAITLK